MSIISNLRRMKKVKTALANDQVVQSCYRIVQTILHPQFIYCGFEPRFVPASGQSASARARGYLIGLVEELFLHHGIDAKANERGLIMLALTFQETYGAYGWNLALDTLDELTANSPAIAFGYDWGKYDVRESDSDQPFKSIMGFARCSGKLLPEAADMPAPLRD